MVSTHDIAGAPRDVRETPSAPLDPRRLGVLAARLAAAVVVAALLVSTLPGLDELRERFAGADGRWLVVAFALEAGSMLAFVAVFRGVFGPRLGRRFSGQVALSQQGVNVLLPAAGAGGLALGAWALTRAGMSTERVARRSVALWLVTSAPNFVAVSLVGALVVGGALTSSASPGVVLVPTVLAVLTVAAVLAVPPLLRRSGGTAAPTARGARRVVRLVGTTVADGVDDTVRLLRRPPVALAAVAYMSFDIAVLGAAFAAFGDGPAAADLLLAYLIGQLGGVLPLPGGVGGTDGGLVAALVLFGTPLAPAAAAVLAYRVFQLGLPALVGAAAFATLRRTLPGDAPAPA